LVRESELTKDIYKPKDVAKMVGVSTKTLREWDKKEGLFQRTVGTDRRFMTKEMLITILERQGLYIKDDSSQKRDVIYARVSSHDQKSHGDLDRQVRFLIDSVPNLQNVLVLSEVGSGLNDKRKKFQKLIQMVMNDEVNRVFVTYKDRLTRFGFHYIASVFDAKHVEIIAINQVEKETSVEKELVNDMMSLIASFSGKLYGLRSKEKRIKKGQNKTYSFEDLQRLVGEEELEQMFIEHYSTKLSNEILE
jgi:DNA binding domain protein, excisionase family